MRNKIKITPLKRIPSLMLQIGLPLIAFIFSYILFYILKTPENEKAWTFYVVCSMLEYAFMSMTLIICGTLLTDMALKE